MLPAIVIAGIVLLAPGSDASRVITGVRPLPAETVGAACPLTINKEMEAVLAFEEMMPVVRHPRCNNCHGGIDPLVPYKQGGHMGDLDTSKIEHNSVQTRRIKCQECHSELPGWDTPGDPMLWNGKTTKQICMQFKAMSNDPADFIGHITNEHGGVQFIETAFKGDRALDNYGIAIAEDFKSPFTREPPPGTQQDLIRQGTTWANLVGPQGWSATPDCGCEVHANAWVGTVTTTYERKDKGFGTWTEQAYATAYFEFDEDMSDAEQVVWKSTHGKITWSAKAVGGECTVSNSGSLPVGIGGDENPMALIKFDTRTPNVSYQVAIGPWKDQYYLPTKVLCPDGKSFFLRTPSSVHLWWHLPVAGIPLGTNDKQLQGSFQMTDAAGGVSTWVWNFQKHTGPRPR